MGIQGWLQYQYCQLCVFVKKNPIVGVVSLNLLFPMVC